MTGKKLLGGAAAAALVVAWMATPVEAQRRDREFREGGCKSELITAAGKATIFGKGRALRLAVDNWQREVREKYGERYMQWEKAKRNEPVCESASIGALGKLNQRCTVAAIPCSRTVAEDGPVGDAWEVQRLLARIGYLRRDEVDGDVGERTRQAIRRFQRSEGLDVTGDVNEGTMERLRRRARG